MYVLRHTKIGATILGIGSIYALIRRIGFSRSGSAGCDPDNISVAEAINRSTSILKNIQDDYKCPGISVAVSLNGALEWQQGFGYADVENRVPCTSHTVMKIASLSKLITSTLLIKLCEMEVVDLDTPIASYVDYWPRKTWKGKDVDITLRQLSSHKGGIRDYKPISKNNHVLGNTDSLEFGYEEYYISKQYKNVKESVSIFKDDPLVAQPGSEFHYSTHGYTLLSAAIECASGKKFPTLLRNLYKDLGLIETYLDDNKQQIIYNRSSHYVIGNDKGVHNAPFTESSFKLAGAGMLSSAIDLVTFGNIILYSYQLVDNQDSNQKSGYLRSNSVKKLWQPVLGTSVSWHTDGLYGMGWQIIPYHDSQQLHNDLHITNTNKRDVIAVGHTGGTVGASSAMLIIPSDTVSPPGGVVVVILANLQGISLGKVALQIAKIFNKCS